MACKKNSAADLCDECCKKLKRARRDPDFDFELCDHCSQLCRENFSGLQCLAATILVNNNGKNCSCGACLERDFLCKNDQESVQDLQKSWTQLRHNIRQMYRDRLLDGFVTGKGKKMDATKIKSLVFKLCSADANQLFERLECQSREYIMEVKVQLLQILLVPPRQIEENSNQTTKNDQGKTLMSDITPTVAEHFLKSLVKLANEFLDTLEKMLPLLERLNDHLAKFQVNWLTVNYSLLDEVFFKDPLVRITLPSVYRILNFPSIFPVLYTLDEKPPEPKFCSELDHVSKLFDRECLDLKEEDFLNDDRKNLMQKLFELDSTIFLFDRQMREARRRMAKFLDEQTKLYHEKLKEKQKMLKEDLEYFKEKRRLLEAYVSKNKQDDEEGPKIVIAADDDDDTASDSDDAAVADAAVAAAAAPSEDLEAFAEALRTLLCVKRASSLHDRNAAESSPKKNRCVKKMAASKKSRSHSNTTTTLRKASKSADCEPENDSSTSSLLTSSADEDEDYSNNVKILDEYKMQVICRRKTSVISGTTKKVTTKVETTFTPKVDSSKQFFIAHGDWQVSDDPATLLLNLPQRKKCADAEVTSASAEVGAVNADEVVQNERLSKALAALSSCKQSTEPECKASLKSQEKDLQPIKIERSCSVGEKIDNNCNDATAPPPQDHQQHCDCCYCEMFGQHQGRWGRDDFMQIRQRLRQKLQKNKVGCQSPAVEKSQEPPLCQNALKFCSQNSSEATSLNQYQSDQIQGYRGNEDLEKILNFIEGDDYAAEKRPKNTVKKSSKKKQKKIVKKSCQFDENPDEVFAPKNVDHLDEVDKEVEYFKKFVSDSCPAKLKKKLCVDFSQSLKSFLKNS